MKGVLSFALSSSLFRRFEGSDRHKLEWYLSETSHSSISILHLNSCRYLAADLQGLDEIQHYNGSKYYPFPPVEFQINFEA